MAQGRGGATQATLAIGLVMLALLLLKGELAESAKDPMRRFVGGIKGWSFNVNDWTVGKTFKANQILVFKYKEKKHNVKLVNSDDYAQCKYDNPIQSFSSGNDRFTLGSGTYYFICGIDNHCSERGMKIKVTAQ